MNLATVVQKLWSDDDPGANGAGSRVYLSAGVASAIIALTLAAAPRAQQALINWLV